MNVYYTGDFRRKRDRSHVCLYRGPHIHHLYWYKNHLKFLRRNLGQSQSELPICVVTILLNRNLEASLHLRNIKTNYEISEDQTSILGPFNISLTPPLFIEGPIPKLFRRSQFYICFYGFSIRVWNGSNGVVFFVFLLEFGTVQTVWYFLFFY